MGNTLRLFLLGNDPLARAGLAQLALQAHCAIVGQASSREMGEPLWGELEELMPDLLIWDVAAGWETAVFALPDLPFPTIALLATPEDAPQVWSSGVQGLLTRQLDSDTLRAAVQAVHQGLRVFAPELLPHLLAAVVSDGEETALDLTPRESEVLQLMAEGLTNKAIAQQLAISSHTVKFHVNAIMGKLHAQSRTEAVVQATRRGLISL